MIPFIDLATGTARIRTLVEEKLGNILDQGAYILGPDVKLLEEELGKRYDSHAVSCASGTDALVLIFRAYGIGKGDAVFVPNFTFVASAEAVVLVGATPVFVDVDEKSMCMDADSLEHAIHNLDASLSPRAVLAVDLFGRLAEYEKLSPIAKAHDLKLIADNAQSFGALLNQKHVMHYADAATTSFFPAKPLGCYGDGGAVFVHDEALVGIIQSLRVHGQGAHKYDNVRIGYTSRLDTMQAAVLLAKLSIFDDEVKKRNEAAKRYHHLLGGHFALQDVDARHQSVWAQFTLLHPKRDALMAALREADIPSGIYYPYPLSDQKPYAHYPQAPCPQTQKLSHEAFSIPMHPYLVEDVQKRIADVLIGAL